MRKPGYLMQTSKCIRLLIMHSFEVLIVKEQRTQKSVLINNLSL